MTAIVDRPAFAAALAAIEREFGAGWRERAIKSRVRIVLSLGAGHPAIKARYRGRAYRCGFCSLDKAISQIERDCRLERQALGLGWSERLSMTILDEVSMTILDELRLILRWLRRYGRGVGAGSRGDFRELICEIITDVPSGQFEAGAMRRDER